VTGSGHIRGRAAIPRGLLDLVPGGGALVLAGPPGVAAPGSAMAKAGAYLLLIRLVRPLTIAWRDGGHVFETGWYLYAGSAKGPGGMRARVSRHMRADKKPHWHVDRITSQCPPAAALCYEGAAECDLVAALSGSAFSFPLPGFGATDCRHCISHLLRWHGGDIQG